MALGKHASIVLKVDRVAYAKKVWRDLILQLCRSAASSVMQLRRLTDMSCIYTDALLVGHAETTIVSSKCTASNSKLRCSFT